MPAARNSRAAADNAAHAAALPFKSSSRRSGRIGNSCGRTPVALQIALATRGKVGTVATSPMPTLPPITWPKPPSSKCTSMQRRVRDAGNAIILQAHGQDIATGGSTSRPS